MSSEPSRDSTALEAAARHLIRYGGTFLPFVADRAEGSFAYDAGGAGNPRRRGLIHAPS